MKNVIARSPPAHGGVTPRSQAQRANTAAIRSAGALARGELARKASAGAGWRTPGRAGHSSASMCSRKSSRFARLLAGPRRRPAPRPARELGREVLVEHLRTVLLAREVRDRTRPSYTRLGGDAVDQRLHASAQIVREAERSSARGLHAALHAGRPVAPRRRRECDGAQAGTASSSRRGSERLVPTGAADAAGRAPIKTSGRGAVSVIARL